MQTFTIINEKLMFKEATVLFSFSIPNNENEYVLYSVSDFDSKNKSLFVSRIVKGEKYFYIKDIKEKRYGNIKSYIEDFINGKGGKKEIKLSRENINFEPNKCQNVSEEGREIKCNIINDLEWAINKLDDNLFDKFIRLEELNDSIYNLIVIRDKDIIRNKEKENIKGNINIFLLTLFAVIFLSVLLFMGYAEFINH